MKQPIPANPGLISSFLTNLMMEHGLTSITMTKEQFLEKRLGDYSIVSIGEGDGEEMHTITLELHSVEAAEERIVELLADGN